MKVYLVLEKVGCCYDFWETVAVCESRKDAWRYIELAKTLDPPGKPGEYTVEQMWVWRDKDSAP